MHSSYGVWFSIVSPSQVMFVVQLPITGIAMLFSAGTFLYVATVHVLTELTHSHVHSSSEPNSTPSNSKLSKCELEPRLSRLDFVLHLWRKSEFLQSCSAAEGAWYWPKHVPVQWLTFHNIRGVTLQYRDVTYHMTSHDLTWHHMTSHDITWLPFFMEMWFSDCSCTVHLCAYVENRWYLYTHSLKQPS